MLTIKPLPADANKAQCLRWLRKAAKLIGLGFHPDTMGREYVTDDGQRSMDDASAGALDAGIAKCRTCLRVYEDSGTLDGRIATDRTRSNGKRGGR